MRYSRPKKRSDKKKLRDAIGAVHLKILKIKRNNDGDCEICGKHTDRIGRFHIMPVGKYPKLEFVDDNILLSGWFCCHFPHHHGGADDERSQFVTRRVKELRGEDYKAKLIERERFVGNMDNLYLVVLYETMKKELDALKGAVS